MTNAGDFAQIDYMVKVGEHVEAHGYTVQGAFPTSPDGVHVTYTIGLWPTHPELMIRGIPNDAANQMLTVMASRVVMAQVLAKCGRPLPEDSRRFVAGRRYGGVLREWNVEVARSPGSHDQDWAVANRWHMGVNFDRLLVTWPDEEGLFPSEEGCAYAHRQVIAGL